jgi:D-erythro-7,8-dihydroneopterin triphosphate epimerase
LAEPRLDRIVVKDLVLSCIIGINPDERVRKQDVVINLVLHADFSAACKSDNIRDAVDYKKLKKKLMAMVSRSQCQLIEHLAQRIADLCLEDKRVRRVEVLVEKPGALRFARSVGVQIIRDQPS